MINISLSITNPFSRRWNILVNKHRMFSKKVIEFNVYETNSIFTVDFHLSTRSDHAGARFDIGILGYDIEVHFYDIRHWDTKKDSWTI